MRAAAASVLYCGNVKSSTPRPTDSELGTLKTFYSNEQIAKMFRGATRRTVDTWVREAREKGEIEPIKSTQFAVGAIDPKDVKGSCERLLAHACGIAIDPGITSPRDRIAQARLAMEIFNTLSARTDDTLAIPVTREGLVERLKASTRSAERKLRVAR